MPLSRASPITRCCAYMERLPNGSPCTAISRSMSATISAGSMRTVCCVGARRARRHLDERRLVDLGAGRDEAEGAKIRSGAADRTGAGDDGGGVDAAGKRNSGRHVAAQMKLDRSDERLAQLAGRRLGASFAHRDGRAPERHRHHRWLVERNAREVARREAPHIGEHGALALVGLADREEQAGAGKIDAAPDTGHIEQRADLGSEGEMLAAAREEQRLDPERIARDEQFAALPVEKDEGVHADEAGERLFAPSRIGGDQHLGVGGGAEDVAVAPERLAQLDEIVDFAVEDDDVAAVRRRHRLVGRGDRDR